MRSYCSAPMFRRFLTALPWWSMRFREFAVGSWSGLRGGMPRLLREPALRSRACIVLAAVLICAYAAGVVAHVVTLPDIGVRSAFSPEVNHFHEEFLFPPNQPDTDGSSKTLKPDDRIIAVGSRKIKDWPELLRCLVDLRHRTPPG